MDQKSKTIITKMFWSSEGWRKERTISDQDKEYLIKDNAWYDIGKYTHKELQKSLLNIIKNIDRNKIVSNFLYSITTRELVFRSPLGSYAIHKNLQEHNHSKDVHCSICGIVEKEDKWDLNVLNFERIKWGGVRHHLMDYAYFDLDTSTNTLQKETTEDINTFKKIINCIKQLPNEARIRDAEKSIKDLLKSNAQEREIFLQILGYCGILQPSNKSSFKSTFVEYNDRDISEVNKIDWTYPVCWWKGKDRINKDALNYYFGNKMDIDFV